MLKIHRQTFFDNLKLTQAYCDLQLKNDMRGNAKVFRSYNPTFGDKKLFSFEIEHFSFEIEPNLDHCTLTKWLVEPTERESIVDDLYEDQLNYKKQLLGSLQTNKTYSGKILVSKIDCTSCSKGTIVSVTKSYSS